MSYTASIPASLYVDVIPGVLGAGGQGLQMIGLALDGGTRVPIGSILSFPTQAAVAAYFGATSKQAAAATVYFNGFTNSDQKPGAMLFTQYPQTAVYPYLRGGSLGSLTLAQLQALSGTLSLVVNGVTRTSSTISLAAATSFSSAATIITNDFPSDFDAVATAASIAAGSVITFTGSITGNLMTVTTATAGSIVIGGVLSGSNVSTGTAILSQASGTTGGVGTYIVSISQNVASETITQNYGLMTVTTMGSGTFAVGQTLSGSSVLSGSTITQLGTGTGGTGTYIISGGAQTVASEAISAGQLVFTYDSVSNAFVATGGTPGTGTITFATGTLSASLALTSATGAVLSQGSQAATPIAFMTNIIAITTNWATFFTLFDPDGGNGNAQKQLFAQWVNGTDDEFMYICFDTDITPTESTQATSSLGYILQQNGNSGTFLIYEPTDYNYASFVAGLVASINFNEVNGRTAFAYKSQSGLPTTVSTATAATNLVANGYNYYGLVSAESDADFQFLFPGSVTGPFQWADSYVNQISLNAALQLAVMTLYTTVKSIPYAPSGYALIYAALLDPIQSAVNFGSITPNVPLSQAQIAEVNYQAGTKIDTFLSSRGWYVQILAASAQVRANRGSPPANFWYVDGGNINKLSLNSTEVQ